MHNQSIAFIETALQMALQSPEVYHLLQEVFALFEQGELKGQQQHKLKGAALQKALQGKYSAKLLHFKMFQGLKVSTNGCGLLSPCFWSTLSAFIYAGQ